MHYRSFRAASEGFHFYCLEAGGGIIAPHCTGGSRGWRLAAAEFLKIIGQVWNSTLHAFPAWARSFITQRDGMSQLSTRGREEKPAIWCFIIIFFSPGCLRSKREIYANSPGLSLIGFWVVFLAYGLPINIFKSWLSALWFITLSKYIENIAACPFRPFIRSETRSLKILLLAN